MLFLEHLSQGGEGEVERRARHRAESAYEPLLIEGSQLIEQYQPRNRSGMR